MRAFSRRTALTCFALLVGLATVVEALAARQFIPAYDWVQHNLSHLGATSCTTITYAYGVVDVCSPAYQWVNASTVIAGLSMIGFATVAAGIAGFSRWAAMLWTVSGVSTLATGLIPIDKSFEWHLFVATPLLIALPLAVLGGSLQLRGLVRISGYFVGAVALVAGVWLLFVSDTLAYSGLLERLVVWPPSMWVIFAAVFGRSRVRSRTPLSLHPVVSAP